MRWILTAAILYCLLPACSQHTTSADQPPLPMLGYTEHFEQEILLLVRPNTELVKIRYHPVGDADHSEEVSVFGPFKKPAESVKIVLAPLEMGTEYVYNIYIDGEKIPYKQPLSFTTRNLWRWRMDAPDFSFLFGSCMYINDKRYDRPGDPYGQGLGIVKQMQRDSADFNLWGGDNLYLREVDWSSPTGIYYRYAHMKRQEPVAKLLASRPNYAVVDDHDMGPNNSNRSYRYKHITLEAFKNNWGNNTFGRPGVPGTFGQFEWSDCDFFLLDNRYYRSPAYYPDRLDGKWNSAKDYLGEAQLQWLKDALASSRATFKFVVSGSQVLNTEGHGECFCDYKREWTELLEFIKARDVRGVIFLSGDRHFTEILKYERDGTYPLYEFTSSPISSHPYTSVGESEEGQNPLRVKGTLYPNLNYMKFEVSGERRNRVLTVSCKNDQGVVVWTRDIEAERLR